MYSKPISRALPLVALSMMLGGAAFADTTVQVGPYKGVRGEVLDYEFTYPVNPDHAPVVEVYQSNGVFNTIIEDKDIVFNMRYRFECGSGRKLTVDQAPEIDGAYSKSLGTEDGLQLVEMTMPDYRPPSGMSPIEACNAVIDQRKAVGKNVAPLLKQGFWRPLIEAYPVTMEYTCTEDPNNVFDFPGPPRNFTPEATQPLFVKCLGDPDYGKETATTSSTTSTRSATDEEIRRALEEKRRRQEEERARQGNRTNPGSSGPTRANPDEAGYRAILNDGTIQQEVSKPVGLNDFMALGQTMAGKGMKLVDVETVTLNGQLRYAGLFNKESGANWFSGPKTRTEFRDLRQEQTAKGMRLVDFEILEASGDTPLKYIGVWRPGSGREALSAAMSMSEFKNDISSKKGNGLVPVDVELDRLPGGALQFHVLWRSPPEGDTGDYSVSLPIARDDFSAERDRMKAKGRIAIDVEQFRQDGKPHLVVLWGPGSGGSSYTRPREYDGFENMLSQQQGRMITDLDLNDASD